MHVQETGEGAQEPGDKTPQEIVCFTAGFRQLLLSVGVAHAYLVTGRRPDHVAGLSVGAVSAAKLQHIFEDPSPEEQRARLDVWLTQVRALPGAISEAIYQSLPSFAQIERPELVPEGDGALRRKAEQLHAVTQHRLNTRDLIRAALRYRALKNFSGSTCMALGSLLLFFPKICGVVWYAVRHACRLRREWRAHGESALYTRDAIRCVLERVLGDWTPRGDERPSHAPGLSIIATTLHDLHENGAPVSQIALDLNSYEHPIDALLDALATPNLLPFEPRRGVCELRGEQSSIITSPASSCGEVVIANAKLVRSNPLPGLFRHLEGRCEPRNIRLVYGEPYEERGMPLRDGPASIGRVGLTTLRAIRRTDYDLERRQTWITTLLLRLATHGDPNRRVYEGDREDRDTLNHVDATVSPIAPEHPAHEVFPGESLGFASDESVHRTAAQGCRHLLEAMFAEELHRLAHDPETFASLRHPPEVDAPLRLDGEVVCLVDCHAFLRHQCGEHAPVIQDLCARCTQCLRLPRTTSLASAAVAAGPGGGATATHSAAVLSLPSTEGSSARLPQTIHDALEQRSGRRPRVALLAEGGVFRGSFQVGAMAALSVARLKPDLISGASIGSGMGAFVAAIMVRTMQGECERDGVVVCPESARKLLGGVVGAYVHVEERVASTRQFEHFLRSLSLHLREARVSPNAIFETLRDAHAASSAQVREDALQRAAEALARLLARGSAEPRIAGELLAALRSAFGDANTPPRLDLAYRALSRALSMSDLGLSYEIMGAELLHRSIEDILHDPDAGAFARDTAQPFLQLPEEGDDEETRRRESIAFFATTTCLETEGSVLLGAQRAWQGYCEVESWWFPYILLASSAFPAFFSPVYGRALHPEDTGTLHPNDQHPQPLTFIDGGVFDNLPALPAVDMLATLQRHEGARRLDNTTPKARLRLRHNAPDLLLAVSLSKAPHAEDEHITHTERAGRRGRLEKLRSIQQGSERLRPLVAEILNGAHLDGQEPGEGAEIAPGVLDEIVCFEVVNVLPNQLNGTFHFEPAVGLDARRLDQSLIDGCFCTLRALADEAMLADRVGNTDTATRGRAMRALLDGADAPRRIAARSDEAVRGCGRQCPHFTADGMAIECPFHDTRGRSGKTLRRVCASFHENTLTAR